MLGGFRREILKQRLRDPSWDPGSNDPRFLRFEKASGEVRVCDIEEMVEMA